MYPYSNVNSLEDVLDEGIIKSMTVVKPSGLWDETAYYDVELCDGTSRNFYDATELMNFIHHWIAFLRGDKH